MCNATILRFFLQIIKLLGLLVIFEVTVKVMIYIIK